MKTARRQLPDVTYLNEYFILNEGGVLLFNERPLHHFKTQKRHVSWNKRFSFTDARRMSASKTCKYYTVTLNRKTVLVHRVIYKMQYGDEPDIIDHIDRNHLNNSPENLRKSTSRHNSENSNNIARNATYLHQGKHRVRARYKMAFYSIGCYHTREQAKDVYNQFQEIVRDKELTRDQILSIVSELKHTGEKR